MNFTFVTNGHKWEIDSKGRLVIIIDKEKEAYICTKMVRTKRNGHK